MHTTWKIIVVYLKGSLKYRRMVFSFLEYLFGFRNIDTGVLCKYYWIMTISGNIEAMFFKLCTRHDNCCHVAITTLLPIVIETEIPSFCFTQGPFTTANLMIRVKTIWLPCLFQALSCCKGLKMILGFWQKETEAKRVSIAMTLGVIRFVLRCTFLVQSLNTASIFPEIFFTFYVI